MSHDSVIVIEYQLLTDIDKVADQCWADCNFIGLEANCNLYLSIFSSVLKNLFSLNHRNFCFIKISLSSCNKIVHEHRRFVSGHQLNFRSVVICAKHSCTRPVTWLLFPTISIRLNSIGFFAIENIYCGSGTTINLKFSPSQSYPIASWSIDSETKYEQNGKKMKISIKFFVFHQKIEFLVYFHIIK